MEPLLWWNPVCDAHSNRTTSVSSTSTSTTGTAVEPCGACGGKGYQKNTETGINVVCPVCGGSGTRFSSAGAYIHTY